MHRRLLLACALAAPLLTLPRFAAAQDAFPSKPVKIVVPFAAGGPADVYARFLGQKLTETMGQPFVVENRPGAGAVIGTDAVAKSPADGYTLLMMSNTQTTNESLVPNKPYQLMRDLTAVAPVNFSDLVMVVHPSVPVNNLREFIDLAKAQPRKLNYASSGTGTPYHMAGELFNAMAGVQITHIPYKGSSGARNDVLGGQVHMMFDAIPTMAQNVRAGKVKALAVTGTKRSDVLPEVPTVAEAGVPGYEATIWLGLMAPAATPKPVIDKLNAAITKITSSPDTRAQWAKQGAQPLIMTPSEFDAYLRQDIRKWAEVVRISGAKPE